MSEIKVKIRKGAIVGQDFSFFRWGTERYQEKVETEFVIENDKVFIIPGRYKLVAKGFGVLNGSSDGTDYGNGSIFANVSDLIYLNGEPHDQYYECLSFALANWEMGKDCLKEAMK